MRIHFLFRNETEADYALHNQILVERVKLLYERLLISFPANLFCATLILIGLYNSNNYALLLSWYFIVIFISIIRLIVMRWWKKSTQRPRLHLQYYIVLTYFAAGTWGFAGSVLIPSHDLLRQTLVIIVIAGVTAGALQSLQASIAASIGYAFFALLPLIFYLGLEDEYLYTLLSLSITAYLVLVCIIALNGYKLIEEVLLLRFKNIENAAFKSVILDSASDCILTLNENNQITSCNKQTEYEFDYSNGELINQNITKILPSFNGVVARYRTEEYEGINKSGKPISFELKTSHVSVKNEQILVMIIRNITERKRLEKMKSDFVSTVSHELRTPLTSINGSLSIVLSGAAGAISDKAKKMLEITQHNCERLLLIINDILNLKKMESGKIEFHIGPVDLASIINESISANKMYADQFGIRLVFTTPLMNIKVNADPDRLMQVLANLISNAVKFSPPGEQVEIAILDKDSVGRVTISNKGPGIPLDFQDRIFQRFTQADPSNPHGGTGLGLNISHSFIEKMHGSLNFKSEPNVLTTFYFDLPKAADFVSLSIS